ncbi:secretoglobin family 1D member 2-like [Tupaia chinensis]|uniref:secretoglobin family 1D member 2-like n=1 Tax=Tupaia chinensis TaxID=246437 RepID=UPI000FFC3736|nr:secretoglobin family 1D member 2-like [Tupaia chinensis]
MRLWVSLLLVTLAFCCYQANAMVCPAVVIDTENILTMPMGMYEKRLKAFNAPADAVQAKLQVKQCIDQMPREDIRKIKHILVEMLPKCL